MSLSYSRPLRLLGTANLVFVVAGVVGLAFQMWASKVFQGAIVGEDSSVIWRANRLGEIAAVLFLVSLAYASVRLLQRKADAISLTSSIFAAELVYVAVAALFVWVPIRSLPSTLHGVIIFNSGIAPQILTGYPVIGLILFNRLVRRGASSLA